MPTERLSRNYECPLCRGNHGSQDCPTLEHSAHVERDSGDGYYVWCSHAECDFDGHTSVATEAEEWAANHSRKVASR
jgi:hypothetical protein